jgi:putative endonuclease
MLNFSVYILECADDTLYVGVTNDLQRRLSEHQSGLKPKAYTFKRLPVKLVYAEHFRYIDQAIRREKQIKKWSAQKKRALIENNMQLLKKLASCRNGSVAEPLSSLDSARDDKVC